MQRLFQVELERLNAATDDINKLEVDLDVSRPTQVEYFLSYLEAGSLVSKFTSYWRYSF